MGVRGVSCDEMTRWGKRTKSKGVSFRDERSIVTAHALVSRMESSLPGDPQEVLMARELIIPGGT